MKTPRLLLFCASVLCFMEVRGNHLDVAELIEYVTVSYLQPFSCKTCYSVESENGNESAPTEQVVLEVEVREEPKIAQNPREFNSDTSTAHNDDAGNYQTETETKAEEITVTTGFEDSTTETVTESSSVDSTPDISTYSDVSSDASSDSTSESSSETSSDFTYETSSENPPTSFEENSTTKVNKFDEMLIQVTTDYHSIRVKLAQSAFLIESQQKVILELSQKIHTLEQESEANRNASKQSDVKFANCLNELQAAKSEVVVARKIFAMERYSVSLRDKLKELQILNESDVSTNKKIVKFSVFEVESEDYSIKILSNRQLFMLPPEIGAIVGNVAEVTATHLGLITLNKNAFDGLSELKILNVSHNKISTIESEVFLELESLQRLDLGQNQISSIEAEAFSGLHELEELNLGYNNLEKLPPYAFESLIDLKVLILSFNKIKQLDHMFTNINVLQEFHATNNLLERIDPLIVSDFERSKVIDLSENICIDQKFPDRCTMIELVIEVSGKCSQRVPT